jgi:hypothetical protein
MFADAKPKEDGLKSMPADGTYSPPLDLEELRQRPECGYGKSMTERIA